MVFDMFRKVALRRAQIAIANGNLDEACRILSGSSIRELKHGQELCYELATALCARAEDHVSRSNYAEALVDLNRAVELGGAKPSAIQLRNEVLAALSAAAAPGRAGAAGERATAAPPRRSYLLWLDGVGTYLMLPFPRVTIGRCGSSARPDIPLPGRIPGIAAEIVRTGDGYVLTAREAVAVNGRALAEKVLAPGDRIGVGESAHLRFYLPCPLSSTAVLRLESPSVLPGKAMDVILLDQFVVIGSKGYSHVKLTTGPRQLVLLLRGDAFFAKTESPIVGAGETVLLANGSPPSDREHELCFDKRISIDGLSFTLTEG